MSAAFQNDDGQSLPPAQAGLPSSPLDPAPSGPSPVPDAHADQAENTPPSDPEADFGCEPSAARTGNATPDNDADQTSEDGTAQTPTDAASANPEPDPFFFDPDAIVAFDGNVEAALHAREQSRALAAALRHAAEVRASSGPPYLGWYDDGAVPATKGRNRFGLDREQLLAAVTHLAAFAGRPKKSQPTVRIALRADLCKLSVASPRYGFAAIAVSPKNEASGFEPGAAPVAFTMPISKLAGIVRTGEPGVPVSVELNGARNRLLILGRRHLLRVRTGVPSQLSQPVLGKPKPVGVLDPVPLAQGLRLLGHVVGRPDRPVQPGSWSRAYVRDGMVFGCRDTVLAVLQSSGLAGLRAMVHAADIGPVSAMVRRLDSSCTGHFVTEHHTVLTDESTWVGLPTEPDIAFRESALLEYLLQQESSDAVMVPCSYLLPELDRLLEAVKGEPGARQIRLRVKGVGTFARMILQVADEPKWHRGLAQLECKRECRLNAGARAKDIDMHVRVEALRHLVGYFGDAFEIANIVLEVLSPSAVFPRPVLRLRHEVEGKGSHVVQAFLIGTP